jgi:hypothetical protein
VVVGFSLSKIASSELRLTPLGVGVMNSPRFKPGGVLVKFGKCQVMLDGGLRAAPSGRVDAGVVSDERSELMSEIRDLARELGVVRPRRRPSLPLELKSLADVWLILLIRPMATESKPSKRTSFGPLNSCPDWA